MLSISARRIKQIKDKKDLLLCVKMFSTCMLYFFYINRCFLRKMFLGKDKFCDMPERHVLRLIKRD